jgi:hypothetical protein
MHLMTRLREVRVTSLPLTMIEVCFFSLGYLTLPFLFYCDGPPPSVSLPSRSPSFQRA